MQNQEKFVVHIPGRPFMSIVGSRKAAIKEVESVAIIADSQKTRVRHWLEGDDLMVCEDREGIRSFILEDDNGWEIAGIAPCIIRE
jgi:hypothetical protein